MTGRPTSPVDLTRARAAEERLDQLLREHPELRERTAAMLAGKLSCPDLKEVAPMPKATMRTIPVRLPPALIERLDALVPLAAGAAELATVGAVTRSDVLRLAVLRGLADLEAEFGEQGQARLPLEGGGV